MNENGNSRLRSIAVALAVIVGVVIYAYGFQVTKVDLEETKSERRQTQLVRILRALARPEILEYERQEFEVTAPIWIDCPEGGVEVPEPDTSGPYMIVDPPCADPREEVRVEGFNFEPETRGPINFIPPSEVTLQLGNIETDETGHFETVVELPNRRPVEEAQHIEVVTRRNVGTPHFTRTAYDTWDKIIETIFMALLATTLGTALAVPISFFAARNLMRDVSSPLSDISLSILAWPVGAYLGAQIARWLGDVSAMLTANISLSVGGLVVLPLIVWGTARWAVPPVDEQPPEPLMRVARALAMVASILVFVISLFLLSSLAITFGETLAESLGAFGFLGTFIADVGDVLGGLIVVLTAMAGGAALSDVTSRTWTALKKRLPPAAISIANHPLAAVAGALLFALLGLAVDWLYQIQDPVATLWGPAAVGALAGLALAVATRREDELSIGLVVYYISRTILNALRSIEPLIMVIVFAVWVGIGPFAGVLALALHTIAALAKLYSEQVESILPGPLEAVKAAGATRLQTIVYAVIPQIVPPYIAFTMYRWDINVRMSTIIGFAGGGGIGFLLQQNINLLNYRAASAQMFAIAIVVATMDYISSQLRERVV